MSANPPRPVPSTQRTDAIAGPTPSTLPCPSGSEFHRPQLRIRRRIAASARHSLRLAPTQVSDSRQTPDGRGSSDGCEISLRIPATDLFQLLVSPEQRLCSLIDIAPRSHCWTSVVAQGRGYDGDTALAPYFQRQVEDAARSSFEAALRDAFPVARKLPPDLIELAGRLNSSRAPASSQSRRS